MTLKNPQQKKVEVYADWKDLLAPRLMGVFNIRHTRGNEIYSFEYDKTWLAEPPTAPLDPELQYFRGELFPSGSNAQFGVFLDSAPDRWGRLLMRRRESIRARQEQRPEQALYESDYLLGVHDLTRLGALRFRRPNTQEFLDSSDHQVPSWTSLRELEEACRQLELDDTDSSEFRHALQLILAPGSSLGGARPKASVKDVDGGLWIAKFPSREDRIDSGAWELVLNQLAHECGITVAESGVESFGRKQRTFMTKRFDREGQHRIHFVSAMTLLQRKDGDSAQVGASYLEIAQIIQTQGARVTEDLEELWNRILFSVLVSNCDDHLRNHGFLLHEDGWVLSPAFDLNPDPQGNGLKLNISENDNSQDLSLVLSVAKYFRIEDERAKKQIKFMIDIVKTWDNKASKIGISNSEKKLVARAFRLTNSIP